MALFVLVVYSGLAGSQVWSANFSRDVHLRDLLGRDAARERAAGRHLLRAQPVALVCQGDPRARAEAGTEGVRPPAPELSGEARPVAGNGPAGRVRVAGAGVRGTRQPRDPRRPVARVLPADARGHARLRRRDLGHQRRRVRCLLRAAVADVAADRRRERRAVRTPSAQRPHLDAGALGDGRTGLRRDRNHHLRRLLQRRPVAQARAPPAEHLLGPQLPSHAGDRARVHDRPAAMRRPHQARLRARHPGGADGQLPLHEGRAEPCLRPHARTDRVRLCARPLFLAADLAGPGDRSSSPRTRSATAPTSSAPLPTGSTTRSSPSRRSGTSR